MTTAELEQRLLDLEREVRELKSMIAASSSPDRAVESRRWWVEEAGRFADDPLFDEMVRLGREYRQSLHPDRKTSAESR